MTAHILIIEDEALVAMELRFVLEDLGHEVVATVADAASALAIVRETDIDLALVDIHLSDGPTGVALGRKLGQDFGVSVLFMTANPGMGCMAALEAVRFLAEQDHKAQGHPISHKQAEKIGVW